MHEKFCLIGQKFFYFEKTRMSVSFLKELFTCNWTLPIFDLSQFNTSSLTIITLITEFYHPGDYNLRLIK